MTEATPLMKKAAAKLFPESEEEATAFLRALLAPVPRGNALVWTVPPRAREFETVDRAELPVWLPESVELALAGVKTGKSPAYLAGEVYPLDFSSVITGSAMLAAREGLPDSPRVLDLCAAPGGKSILASVLLTPGLLLANEVEGKRLGILRHNLARCRLARTFTQRLASEEFARLAPAAFDLVLVDAPCSGQSLLAKGMDNPGCFHPATVKGNARRQRRILEAAGATVAPGGFLLYTTCTFSLRENEEAVEKFLAASPVFEAVAVSHLDAFRSPFSNHPAYRVYPHRSPGAGGFAMLLRRRGERPPLEATPLPSLLLDYPVGDSSSSGSA